MAIHAGFTSHRRSNCVSVKVVHSFTEQTARILLTCDFSVCRNVVVTDMDETLIGKKSTSYIIKCPLKGSNLGLATRSESLSLLDCHTI